MSTLNNTSSNSTTPSNTTSSSSSSSLSTPIVTTAPFHNVRVFLHIREHNDIDGSDRTKHHAKKALRTLGATLTLSENTADLIVFHCGNDSLLANATARGKVVVRPSYLQACVARGMRLPVDEFLVQSPLNTTIGKRLGKGTEKKEKEKEEEKEEDMNRNHHVLTSSSLSHKDSKVSMTGGKEVRSIVLETAKSKPVKDSTRAVALSEVPYLDDEEDEDEEEEREKEENKKNVDYSTKKNQKSADNIETRTPLLSNDNLDSRTNTHSGKNKTTNKKKKQEQQSSSSCKGEEECVSAVNKENKSNNTTREEVTVAIERSGDCTASRRGDKRPRDTMASSINNNNNNNNNTKKNGKGGNTTTVTAVQTGSIEETTPSTMTFTENNLITPLFPPPPQHSTTTTTTTTNTTTKRKRSSICVSAASVPLRIAVSGENEDVIHFLSDVVEQLGANCVSRVFGRGRKPTHLVLEGRGELTPVVLIAIALGIPVLTPQWLYDAISLGAFPNIIESHLHPIYNNNNSNNNNSGGNRKESCEKNEELHKKEDDGDGDGDCPGVGGRIIIKRRRKNDNDIGEKLVDLLGEDVGPHYKAIFLGMSFAFVSHSPLAHTDQFIELVRILGGTVSRSALGVNLSVIVDLGYGTATQQEEENEEKEHVKGRKTTNSKKQRSRQSIMREGNDEMIRESQFLSMTYRTVLSDNNAGVSSHPSQDILQGIITQRLQNGLSAVPIVSVEWIIQCILLGEVTEMTPFEVPLAVNASIKTVMEAKSQEDTTTRTTTTNSSSSNSNNNDNSNSNSCCSNNSGGNMNEEEELFTPPEQTTWRDGKNKQVKSKHNKNTVISRLPPLIADPLAKTAEGPSSAKKSAEQQLNTQQLLLLDDSDIE